MQNQQKQNHVISMGCVYHVIYTRCGGAKSCQNDSFYRVYSNPHTYNILSKLTLFYTRKILKNTFEVTIGK